MEGTVFGQSMCSGHAGSHVGARVQAGEEAEPGRRDKRPHGGCPGACPPHRCPCVAPVWAVQVTPQSVPVGRSTYTPRPVSHW